MSEEPTVTLGGPGAQPSRLRRKRAPAMSLTSLNLGGEVPPFFTFVVEAKLAACGDFDPEKVSDQLKNLARRRVGGVISLTERCLFEKVSPASAQGIRCLHLPTRDLTPPTLEDLLQGVKFITEINNESKAVVVHCAKGIGRTGTMLGAYFIVAENMTALNAITCVRDRRPGSIHKKCQEQMLYELEERLTGTSTRPEGFDEGGTDD